MSASTQDMTPRTTEPLGPAEVGPSHEAPARSGADPNRSTPPYPSGYVRGARMVRLEGFEEPFRMAEPERETYHRRFGILFVDDSSARRGGLGTVVRATNALGETCALKTLNAPVRAEHEDDASFAARVDLAHTAFRTEYESHRSLSGFKGFPRLFGFAHIGDTPRSSWSGLRV